MGAGYSRACHSRPSPPTIYTLNHNGTIVPQTSGKSPFNNAPIVKVENLRPGSGFRNTCRKILARCSFSPGWIRYERLLTSITELSHMVFSGAPDAQPLKLELHITSPVKPLGMAVGDKIKERDLRRFEVSASLCLVRQTGGGLGRGRSRTTVLLDCKSAGVAGGDAKLPSTQTQTQMQMQDWRRFDSRRITLEAQLRALEAVERDLLARREQILMQAVEALKLGGVRDGDEDHAVDGDGVGGGDVGVDMDLKGVKEVGVRRRVGKR